MATYLFSQFRYEELSNERIDVKLSMYKVLSNVGEGKIKPKIAKAKLNAYKAIIKAIESELRYH